MAVQRMTIRYGSAKPRPKIGDQKTSKDGTVLVLRQCHTREGQVWLPEVRGNRPVTEWVPVGTPWPWEK